MIDKNILVYDAEVFIKDWMFVIVNDETEEKTVIVNNEPELRKFYDLHCNDIWVGYNSREYDQYILKGILLGTDPYYINDEIINNGKRGWQVVKDKGEYPLYNFDVSTGFHSLKQLEGFMGSTIKESDIPFDIDRKLTAQELTETEFYCTHDVMECRKVFSALKKDFNSHLLLIEAFDLPMTMFNKTKAQLAANILGAKRGANFSDEFNITIPDTLQIGEKYQFIVDWYKNQDNHNYSKSLVVDVAGVSHVFAWGGLHAARPNYTTDGLIAHCDVQSLYPSIMIEYDFLSRNVQEPWRYKEIRDKRLQYKKEKNPIEAPLKIVLNSTYGVTKDAQNPLYDPLQANNVCVAGQLLLLDLIEKLEGCGELIQSNTDGLFFKVNTPEDIVKMKTIASEWEKRTRLVLEWDTYKKIYQKDVNNYILINNDGEYESKGAYVKKLSTIDYDLPIVNKALIEYFTKGIPVSQTVSNCNQLIEFQKIIKITNLYLYALHGDKKIKEKVLRVFASNNPNSPGIQKVKSETKIEKVSNTPEKCFIYNDSVIGVECPDELDKAYYINVAEERLNAFLSEKPNKNSKLKSDVKFLSYDDKLFAENVNFSEYEHFLDVVNYLRNDGKFSVRQITILIKLDFFNYWGNVKELLRMMDCYEFFKFGAAKYLKKETLQNSEFAFLSDVVLNNSDERVNAYTLKNVYEILYHCESYIKTCNLSDFTKSEKVACQIEFAGGVLPSYKEEERPILYVTTIKPLLRNKDSVRFGYSIIATSLGSGKTTEYTIFNEMYNRCPVSDGSVIKCLKCDRNGGYFTLRNYVLVN